MVAKGDGLGPLQMGVARHDRAGVCFRLDGTSTCIRSLQLFLHGRCSLFRRYRRISSATWSFRLRAVCRRLPASPMRAVSSPSTKVWMSSGVRVDHPASPDCPDPPKCPASPWQIASLSLLSMIPHCSQHGGVGHSCPRCPPAHIRLSKEIAGVKVVGLGVELPFGSRPFHSFIMVHLSQGCLDTGASRVVVLQWMSTRGSSSAWAALQLSGLTHFGGAGLRPAGR